MIKTKSKRPSAHSLLLHRETLRLLGTMELRKVAGGDTLINCDDDTTDASFGRGCLTKGPLSDCPC